MRFLIEPVRVAEEVLGWEVRELDLECARDWERDGGKEIAGAGECTGVQGRQRTYVSSLFGCSTVLLWLCAS